MTTVLYARVSTSEQTIDHQCNQAEAAGFTIEEVVADEGVSGVNTRLRDRPQGRRLFDLLRRVTSVKVVEKRVSEEVANGQAAMGGSLVGSASNSGGVSSAIPSICM